MRSAVPPGVRVAREWAWSLGLIALAGYGAVQVIGRFSDIFVPVLIALLLSALLHPLVRRLSTKLPHGVAALIVLLAALLLIAGLFTLVGQQTASGIPALSTQAIAGVTEIQKWLSTGPLHLSLVTLNSYVSRAQTFLTAHESQLATGALGVTASATHLVEGFFITLFSTFFFMSSGHRIWAWLLRILPRAAERPLDEAARSGWVTLSHYVRATFIVASVDGLGVGVGAAVLGVPLALPLGVLVFMGAFIPIVGALLTGSLAILVALVAKGPVTALIVLAIVIAINQLEAHVLQPFLLGRAVEVHPLAVILALAAGASLAGIPGALFAVPTAAVGNTIITSLAHHGRQDPGERIAEEQAPLAPDRPAATDLKATPDTQRSSITETPTGRPSHN